MRNYFKIWGTTAILGGVLGAGGLTASDTDEAGKVKSGNGTPYYAVVISRKALAALKIKVAADFSEETRAYRENAAKSQELIKSPNIIGAAIRKRLVIIDSLLEYTKEELQGDTVNNIFKAKKAVRELGQFNDYLHDAVALYNMDKTLNANRISVKDFGAAGDGKNDDGPAIRKAVAHAAALGGKTTVLLPKGKYFIADAEPAWDYQKNPVIDRTCNAKRHLPLDRAHIPLVNLENMIIEGEPGAELYFGNYELNGFTIFGCANVTLRNLSLGNRKELSFSQGVISEVDSKNKSCVFQPDAGFPSPEDDRFVKNKWFGFTRTSDGADFVRRNASCSTYHFSKVENLGDNRYKLFLNKGYNDIRELAVGQKLTFFSRSNYPYMVRTKFSAFCTLDNITVRNSGNGVFNSANSVSLHVVNCTVKPLTGNFGITPADGLYSGNNLIAPYLCNTTFSHIGDDCFNIFAHSAFIQRVEGRDVYIGTSVIVFSQGDMVQLFSPTSGQVIAEGIVGKSETVEINGKRGLKITMEEEFNVPVVAQKMRYGKMATTDGEKKKVQRIPYILMNADRVGIGAVAVNNTFIGCSNNGVKVMAPNALVEDNAIVKQQRGAIVGTALFSWNEIPGPTNLIIRNNKIKNATHGINIYLNNAGGTKLATIPFSAIRVENNTIEDCHVPLAISNADNPVVKKNNIK